MRPWQRAVECDGWRRLEIPSMSWNRVGTHEAKRRPGMRRRRHDLDFTRHSFEPEGREFESLRARTSMGDSNTSGHTSTCWRKIVKHRLPRFLLICLGQPLSPRHSKRCAAVLTWCTKRLFKKNPGAGVRIFLYASILSQRLRPLVIRSG
jgi:hypothetical protein